MNQRVINVIKKSFDENINSHAFLVETNDVKKSLKDVIKLIFSINNIEDSLKGEYNPDIKIIEPDGKEIKREQVSKILTEFQTFPVVLKHRYYIILESDTMNQSSANTILKFLEEPEGAIIGFFITSNKSAMISTIMSRCQHYKLIYDDELNVDINKIEDFLLNMESNEKYKKVLFLNNVISKDRVENIKLLKSIKEYLLKVSKNDNIYSIKLLVKRVGLLDNVIERLRKNANQELIILDLARNWK